MDLKLVYDSKMPIYIQLKEQIRHLILSGSLKPGTKLPPVRQLASYLRIDRNTAIRVYQELEAEGCLVMQLGRGTFVRGDFPEPEWTETKRLFEIADEAFEAVVKSGLDPERFAQIVASRWRYWKLRSQVAPLSQRIGFVECDQESLDFYTDQLSSVLRMKVEPILLSEISGRMPSVLKLLSEIKVFVTPFFHLKDVRRLLPDKHVIGIIARPQLTFLSKIAELPKGTEVGVICATRQNAEQIVHWITGTGAKLNVRMGYLEEPETVERAIERSKYLIVSAMAQKKLANLIKEGTEVLSFATILDTEAIEMIRDLVYREARDAEEIAISSDTIKIAEMPIETV